MYLRILFGISAIALLTFILSPVGYGQFPPGGGGFGGGKGGFGGGRGGFGGGRGGFGGGMRARDPNERFDQYAKGRPFFVITEMSPGMQQFLNQYAQEKNVQFPSGQVTREQYLGFADFLKEKFASGNRMFGRNAQQNPPGTIGTPNGPIPVGNGAPTLEQLQQLADTEFKSRDENGDGKLNTDEMPRSLRDDLARWDTNKDGMIDQNEYRGFFLARAQQRFSGGSPGMQPAPSAVEAVLDEDLDKRPTVYRAGKLPTKGMPTWFMQLDTDADGQVALYEWRAGGRDMDEFGNWDKDDDGFITPEEALKVQAALSKTPNPLRADNTVPTNATTLGANGFNGRGGFGPGGFGGGKGGFGGRTRGGPGGSGMMPQWSPGGGDTNTMSPFGGGKGKGSRKGRGGFGGNG